MEPLDEKHTIFGTLGRVDHGLTSVVGTGGSLWGGHGGPLKSKALDVFWDPLC